MVVNFLTVTIKHIMISTVAQHQELSCLQGILYIGTEFRVNCVQFTAALRKRKIL